MRASTCCSSDRGGRAGRAHRRAHRGRRRGRARDRWHARAERRRDWTWHQRQAGAANVHPSPAIGRKDVRSRRLSYCAGEAAARIRRAAQPDRRSSAATAASSTPGPAAAALVSTSAAGIAPGGRVGAADARRPRRLPPPGAADGPPATPRRAPPAPPGRCGRSGGRSASCVGWDSPDGGRDPQRPDAAPPAARGSARRVQSARSSTWRRSRRCTCSTTSGPHEIVNRTVHGVMHIGWVPRRGGRLPRRAGRATSSPTGCIGNAYMAAIRPFRHLIACTRRCCGRSSGSGQAGAGPAPARA